MARIRRDPRRSKTCVFCEYWTGDADLVFVNSTVGYEYEALAVGKCMRDNQKRYTHSGCTKFEPNVAARKVMKL